MKIVQRLLAALILGQIVLPQSAMADQLIVTDASQIKWVVNADNKVYFRNLDQFDPNWLGCCYNFWIDLTTEYGKAQYATFLTKNASRAPIAFLVNSRSAAGHMLHVGDW